MFPLQLNETKLHISDGDVTRRHSPTSPLISTGKTVTQPALAKHTKTTVTRSLWCRVVMPNRALALLVVMHMAVLFANCQPARLQTARVHGGAGYRSHSGMQADVLNRVAELQAHRPDTAQPSEQQPRQSHEEVFETVETLRNNALISAFKLKLLKLLDVDEVPSPTEINPLQNPVPEPILREYNRLVKINEKRSRSPNKKKNGKTSGLSRGSRDMDKRLWQSPDHEDGNDEHESDFDDETMRFNGSVVQQVTLLPKKLNPADFSNLDDNSWCNGLTEEKPVSLDETQSYDDNDDDHHHHHDHDENDADERDDYRSEKSEHNAARSSESTESGGGFRAGSASEQPRQQTAFVTLNCFTFALEQREFTFYDIGTADVYVKFDMAALNPLLFSPQALSKLSVERQLEVELASYLYVEVNGRQVKRTNLLGLSGEHVAYDAYDEEEAAAVNRLSMSTQRAPVFESVSVKDIIEEERAKLASSRLNKSIELRVKLLCRAELFNYTRSERRLKSLFAHIDESVALHVKFGDLLPYETVHRINSEQHHTEAHRHRRESGASGSDSATGSGSGAKVTPRVKNYRDCSELRVGGSTAANYSCCRETISFSMEQIGWSHWILSPKVIEYKYCRGGCLTGISSRFQNTQIVYKMFEMTHTFETAHCCNIYDYEDDIPFIYGSPPNYLTKMVSLNAKSCLCS